MPWSMSKQHVFELEEANPDCVGTQCRNKTPEINHEKIKASKKNLILCLFNFPPAPGQCMITIHPKCMNDLLLYWLFQKKAKPVCAASRVCFE